MTADDKLAPRYCEVVVEIARAEVARVFTYAIPEGVSAETGSRVLVPFGGRKIEGYVLRLAESCELAIEKIKPIIRTLDKQPALLPELIRLAEWMTGQYACLLVEALRLLIPAQMRGERVREKTEAIVTLADHLKEDPQALTAAIEASRKGRAAAQADALETLADAPGHELPRAVMNASAVSALVKKGLMAIERREILRAPRIDEVTPTLDPPLTVDQSRVLDALLGALSGRGGAFMLWGVTGSGKTEVFIRLAKAALEAGRGVIVLVPEISLTPQMTNWFHARFGGSAAVLHSRLSPGERYDEWRRIRRGDARVVIGARSAVFAPVERLGVIVVDEEHEHTYLSERHPCYDAREVARKRCEDAGAVLLLSSATPALPDFARALRGDFRLLEMPKRVLNRPMPEAALVDMRKEIARGNFSVISSRLAAELSDCILAGNQAILLMNRRGYSTFVSCRACGYVERCEQCDVSMTYHIADGSLRCHYCGASRTPPEVCPACGSSYIRFFGAGTQKVEQTVRELYPGVSLLRMDSDTTRGKNDYIDILKQFRDGEASVMVGTQMIAKGLDFPRVTLVGVIAADAMLHLPDYRSPERTFQLITQAAGRAGRAERPGKVVVQCYDPDHYSVKAACAQDYRSFYEQEIVRRRHGLYPPYTRMTRVLYEGADAGSVQAACEANLADMEKFFARNPALTRQVVHMNAREAPVKFIKGQFRWQLFLKVYARGESAKVLEKMSALAAASRESVRASFQVDPPSLL